MINSYYLVCLCCYYLVCIYVVTISFAFVMGSIPILALYGLTCGPGVGAAFTR